MAVDPVRDAAIDVLLRIANGEHLDRALEVTFRRKAGRLSSRGRRFLTQLVYGTVRHQRLCDFVLAPLLRQPVEDLPLPIRLVLRMGIFQSIFLNQVTPPAMVHTSVDLAKKRGHAGTARLVNAVLRRAPHDLDGVNLPDRTTDPADYIGIRYSLPGWLAERWIDEYGPEEAGRIAAASTSEAPHTIRVNTLSTAAEDLVATLAKSGYAAQPVLPELDALEISSGLPIDTKAFQRGDFTVQDTASMVASVLLAPQPGDRVLDLCAAPGGKTTHLAALSGDEALIVALDRQPKRLRRLTENVERLGLRSVRIVAGDGVFPPFQQRFSKVLVDAPCTGLGTLRRNPDIKWRVQPGDPARLAEIQANLLRSAAHVCENEGSIVYSVCTFTAEETVQVVGRILGELPLIHDDGPDWLDQWKINRGQYLIRPAPGGPDGYFLTLLRKAS